MASFRYTYAMNPDKLLERWIKAGCSPRLPRTALRLAARIPEARAALGAHLTDPLERALLGIDGPARWQDEADLERAALGALATAEAGEPMDTRALEALEVAATGQPSAWVPAATAHALASPARERAGRMRLSAQELPFAAPGELHPLVVEVLALGDRVLPALHVDWVRKLTGLAAEALPLDARALGFWFLPALRALSPDRITRPLQRLPELRRLPAGGRGPCAAYLTRVGADPEPALRDASELDQLIAALALLGDRWATP